MNKEIFEYLLEYKNKMEYKITCIYFIHAKINPPIVKSDKILKEISNAYDKFEYYENKVKKIINYTCSNNDKFAMLKINKWNLSKKQTYKLIEYCKENKGL